MGILDIAKTRYAQGKEQVQTDSLDRAHPISTHTDGEHTIPAMVCVGGRVATNGERISKRHTLSCMSTTLSFRTGRQPATGNALRDTFILAEDGARLHALYLYADTLTAHTAVAVHGYTDNAVRMLHIAYLYNHDLHYNVLLPRPPLCRTKRRRPHPNGMERPS